MGVFYNVHRWYTSGTGRYTRPDPMRSVEQGRRPENTYGYAVGNPLSFTDPVGLASRWYAPGVVYNAWVQPLCSVYGDSQCLVTRAGGLSNPVLDADFVLVPSTCKWIKLAVGIATVRSDGSIYLPPSSRFTGGGREATDDERQQFNKSRDDECECSYCGG